MNKKTKLLNNINNVDATELLNNINNVDATELLNNINKIHTTELGLVRIKRKLSLDTDDVIGWCKNKILKGNSIITRQGKNWYANIDGCKITINAYSYTIITAHLL